MYLSYNSNKIIPAPFVRFENEWIRNEDGTKVGRTVTATLTGKFLHGRGGLHTGAGYPANDFTKCPLEDLLSKQRDLRDLFNTTDGCWFEIQPDDEASAEAFRWLSKVRSIEFPEDLWNPVCDYTVVLELQTAPWDHVTGIDESWDLQQDDGPVDTYTLTHNISCSSKEEYTEALASVTEGWVKAYDNLPDLGIDTAIVNSAAGVAGFELNALFVGYQYRVQKVCDEANGRFEITETWFLSDQEYSEEQTVSVEYSRDTGTCSSDGITVTIEGNIIGHETTPRGTGYSNAGTRWSVVEPTLYTTAALFAGVTLNTEPTTKSVTYNELGRTINYSYGYDDTSGSCTTDVTTTISSDDTICDKLNVSVSGNIQGHRSSTQNAYDNALDCFNALTISTLASTAYTNAGGGGTLNTTATSTSISLNECQGTVGFEYSYHDDLDSTTHDKTITTRFDRSGDVTTVSVAGTVVADCSGAWSDVTTEFATVSAATAYSDANGEYNGYGDDGLCSFPSASSITKDENNRTITYSYEFSDDEDCIADVEENVVVATDPDNCGKNRITVEGSSTGRRTSGSSPWANAQTSYSTDHTEVDANTTASAYVGGTLYRISKSITYAEAAGRISWSYEFSDDNVYQIDETVTTAWDEECGYLVVTQEGSVTGLCTASATSAYQNAVVGFATVSNPSGVSTKIRSSASHNENKGTINYSYEFTDRTDPYIIDFTETTREKIDDCYDIVTIEGTVTGICSTNTSGTKWTNAWAGYQSLTPISPAVGSNYNQMSKTVGKNEYAGRVTFSYEFKQQDVCVPGAISNSVDVTDELAADVFAVVEVIGGGPVIQDKGGATATSRTVSINVNMPVDCSNCLLTGEPNVESIVTSAQPTGDVVVVQKNSKQWNPRTGRFTRTKTWVYGSCTP